MSALAGASTHDGARDVDVDVDFVARLGPFPQWLDKLKQPKPVGPLHHNLFGSSLTVYVQRAPDPTPLNYTTIFRDGWPDDEDPRAPGPSKGQETFGYSYFAQVGGESCSRERVPLVGIDRPEPADDEWCSSQRARMSTAKIRL